MEQVVVRYLAARKLDARPSTVVKLELGLRRFMGFLTDHAPHSSDWGQVTREDASYRRAALLIARWTALHSHESIILC